VTPQPILGGHPSDESLKLPAESNGDRPSSADVTANPINLPALTLPPQNRVRLHNTERMTPTIKASACQNPKAPIHIAQARPGRRVAAPATAGANKGSLQSTGLAAWKSPQLPPAEVETPAPPTNPDASWGAKAPRLSTTKPADSHFAPHGLSIGEIDQGTGDIEQGTAVEAAPLLAS
jgi:hypothetical protein